MKIPVIIPAYEPDYRLIELLEKLISINQTIILVNDGSSAEYSEIFSQALSIIEPFGGILLTHKVNCGKGKALKTAFAHVIENIPDALGVITADSDGQHTTECIRSIADAFEQNPHCLILGVRSFDGDDIPWKSKFGNNLTINVMKYVSGLTISDTQTGLRAIPMDFMKELVDFGGDRFEFETEMLLATSGKYDIKEVKIQTIYESKDNHQTHFNPIKDSIKIYKILGRQFFKYIIASASSFVLDILLFYIFCQGFKESSHYIVYATVVARVFSSIYNFAINYKKVFKGNETIARSAIKYFILAIIQMSCSAWLVTWGVMLTKGNETLVKIIVDSILFLISFKIQQSLVFSKARK